jgi:ubiquinone/menaquinone biosynthesis C-methylase UbiE
MRGNNDGYLTQNKQKSHNLQRLHRRFVEFLDKSNAESFYQLLKLFYQELITEWVAAGNDLIELVWHLAKEFIANRLFKSIEELEYLLHQLLNEGQLIIMMSQMSMSQREIVQQSYNRQATTYTVRKHLQTGNLNRLLDVLFSQPQVPSRGTLLDIGCGDGILLDVLMERFSPLPYHYQGIDLSPEMIRLAWKSHENSECFHVGDAENLPFADHSQDLIISNSVLHWLNFPEQGLTPEATITEVSRVLRKDGKFAVSIAGFGTTMRFLESYQHVMAYLAANGRLTSNAFYRSDPIGSMNLHTVVNMLLSSEFTIDFAHLEYEPITYESPSKFAEVVEAYGYDIFLNSVPENEKSDVWHLIVQEFENSLQSGVYVHNQYMIYIVATHR